MPAISEILTAAMRRTGRHSILRSAFFIAAAAVVSACANTSETVFTHQNQAAAALATMGIEAEENHRTKLDMIYAAETRLDQACAALRDVAYHRMNGEDVSIASELHAMFTLNCCAAETNRAEGFIWRENPPVARFYLGSWSSPQPQK